MSIGKVKKNWTAGCYVERLESKYFGGGRRRELKIILRYPWVQGQAGLCACMGYLSVAVIKQHGQCNLYSEWLIWDLWFQREKNPLLQRIMAISGRHGSRDSGEPRAWTSNRKQTEPT